MKKKIVTNSEKETIELGKKFGRILESGDVVALEGGLAAGKTTFIKGVCDELKIEEDVGSPTFTLINEYNGQMPVYHIDCYREHSIKGWLDIGIEEYLFDHEGVTIIEWSEMIAELLPDNIIKIEIEQDFKNENWRAFKFIFPDQSGFTKEKIETL